LVPLRLRSDVTAALRLDGEAFYLLMNDKSW